MDAIEKHAVIHRRNYIILVSGLERSASHTLYDRLGYDRKGLLGFKKYLKNR
jgi:hypothetical protein